MVSGFVSTTIDAGVKLGDEEDFGIFLGDSEELEGGVAWAADALLPAARDGRRKRETNYRGRSR